MNWRSLLNPVRSAQKKGELVEERSPFDRDYDRIIFSQPFRRLQDKTQVFPLPEDAFVHTRLTHSLEVSSVARSLGRIAGKALIQRHSEISKLGLSEMDIGTITASAALAHDIGNPPFGHSGEQVISDFFERNPQGSFFKSMINQEQWADLLNFEGNAQGFRLLNTPSFKLTFPVLGAFTKYPRPAAGNYPSGRRSYKKFGYFDSEKDQFREMSEMMGMVNGDLSLRHPLAFLVEAADDICYHIIDLEDGSALGLVSQNETLDLLEPLVPADFDWNKFRSLPSWNEKISVLRAVVINRLISDSVEVFLDHEEDMLSGQFDQALVDQLSINKELEDIINVSIDKLYRAKVVREIEVAGFRIIEGLLEVFLPSFYRVTKDASPSTRDKVIYRIIPEEYKQFREGLNSDYLIVRRLLDFISGMTDRYAISIYKKINGIELAQL